MRNLNGNPVILRHKFKPNKFGAIKKTVDGIKFASTKEANYYCALKLRVKAGEVLFFLRQTPFHFPGGGKYVVDFTEFHADGSVHFVDVKGLKTESYLFKKREIEHMFPIEIEEA